MIYTATHNLAVAAGTDAANRRMRAQGRAAWDEDDFNLAAETYGKLMPATTQPQKEDSE